MEKKILIVEDDKAIIRLLSLALKTNNYNTTVAESGIKGISYFLNEKPDLVLLDLGLPDVDGMEVLSQIRAISDVPVIVVSAREKEKEKVEALDNGADDYVTKPFNVAELIARIRVALRRNRGVDLTNTVFHYKGFEMDFGKHKVFIDGSEIHLTPIEFKIMQLLVENQGNVLTHNYIQKTVWGYENNDDNQSLRVYMAGLRRKIEKDTSNPQYIVTEVGIGYRFVNE